MKNPKAENRLFYGWIVVLASFFTYLTTYGPRIAFGNLTQPWQQEFGWNMQQISLAASLGLFMYGLSQPLLLGIGVRGTACSGCERQFGGDRNNNTGE